MSYSRISIDGNDTNDGPYANGRPSCEITTLADPEDVYFKKLLDILENGNEEDFLIKYSSTNLLKNNNDIQIKLFIQAIKKNISEEVVKKILFNITKINYTKKIDFDRKTTIETTIFEDVFRAGYLEVFRELLSLKHLELPKTMEILHTMIFDLDENLFKIWFDVLLENFKEFDVNEDYDIYSPVHVAYSLGKKQAVQKLLEAGAYIGDSSFFKQNNSIRRRALDPQVIEECFDYCIDGELTDTHKYITFNYKNLVPPKSSYNLNEMLPIRLIIDSKEHIGLLKHPLIRSFMALKWQQTSKLLYLNVFFYVFYLISIVSYIVLITQHKESGLTNLTWWLTIFGTAYLIIREAIQFSFTKQYLKKPSNYMEVLLIIFSISMIIDKSLKKEIIAWGIILIALEFWDLVGNLPIFSLSTHMLMLKEVLKTFLKSFSLYAIFVFAFALSFFVLLQEKKFNYKNEEESTNTIENIAFNNIFKSVVQTLAMVVGELNVNDLKLTGFSSYMLILLFIVCMTVVLVNLLIGLAVSDIQAIRERAKINGLICRATFLHNHDLKLFFPDQHDKDCNCKYDVSGVYLNDEVLLNKIVLPHECLLCHTNHGENTDTEQWTWKSFCNFWQRLDLWLGNVTEMNLAIVDAKTVIMKKMIAQRNTQNQLQNLTHIVENIYKKSHIIEEQVQSIEQNVKHIMENEIRKRSY